MQFLFKPSKEALVSTVFWLALGFSGGWWAHSLNQSVTLHPQPLAEFAPAQKRGATTTSEDSPPFRQTLDDYRLTQKSQPAEAELQREWILSHAERLLKEDDQRAGDLLDRFLDIDAYDPRAMLLKARAALAAGRLDEALDVAVELRQLSQAEVSRKQIDELLKAIVNQYTDYLTERERFAELLALYRRITLIVPEDLGYQYKLADIQFRLGDYFDASASLGPVIYDPTWGEQARRLLQKVQQYIALEDGEQVALESLGDHFLVNAQIEYIGGIRLLIDTGASVSSLRPEVARRLGVDFSDDDTVLVHGANNTFNAPRATVSSMILGEIEMEDIDINIIEMGPGVEADGLLGMNFLGQFRFFIDQDRELLLLGAR